MQSVFFQRGAFVSEPAILVKRTNMGSQVWSMEKLENKLVDMRDMYEDRKDPNNCQRLPAIKVYYLVRSSFLIHFRLAILSKMRMRKIDDIKANRVQLKYTQFYKTYVILYLCKHEHIHSQSAMH